MKGAHALGQQYAHYLIERLGGEVIEHRPNGRGGYSMVVAFGAEKYPIRIKASLTGRDDMAAWQPDLRLDADEALGSRAHVVLLIDIRRPGHERTYVLTEAEYRAFINEHHNAWLDTKPGRRRPRTPDSPHTAINDWQVVEHEGAWWKLPGCRA
jgi:hypothetical protein